MHVRLMQHIPRQFCSEILFNVTCVVRHFDVDNDNSVPKVTVITVISQILCIRHVGLLEKEITSVSAVSTDKNIDCLKIIIVLI
jgi:hypothetical protein